MKWKWWSTLLFLALSCLVGVPLGVCATVVTSKDPIYLQHPELIDATILITKWLVSAILSASGIVGTAIIWMGRRFLRRVDKIEMTGDKTHKKLDAVLLTMNRCDGCREALKSVQPHVLPADSIDDLEDDGTDL
jgi:hypothetical protein